VADQCAIAQNANLSNLLLSINNNLYYPPSSGGVSVANFTSSILTNAAYIAANTPRRSVVSDTIFYDGGGSGTQSVSVVDALVVGAKSSADSSVFYVDIAQLLAQALYNPVVDDVYPNILQPYLADLNDIDVQLIVVNEYLPTLVSLGGSINATLNSIFLLLQNALQVSVPIGQNFGSAATSSRTAYLAPMLFDALYLADTNNIFGNHLGGFIQYLPLVRALAMPYLDPNVPQYSSCNVTTGSGEAPSFPYGTLLGPGVFNQYGSSYSQSLATSIVSNLPYQSISRCVGGIFGQSVQSQLLAGQTSGDTALNTRVQT